MNNTIDLEDYKIIKAVEEQTALNRNNSNIVEALQEAKERAIVYDAYDALEEKKLLESYGIQPDQCYNSVCEHCLDGKCDEEMGRSCSCIYRMIESPPNPLCYNEYMPSHHEALDRLEAHGLLKGERLEYQKECAQYERAQTQNERRNTEIKGITLNQLTQAVMNILNFFKEHEPDLTIQDEDSFDVIARNICLEVEKAMGIYPNIRPLR
jgi:hypothetical protein